MINKEKRMASDSATHNRNYVANWVVGNIGRLHTAQTYWSTRHTWEFIRGKLAHIEKKISRLNVFWVRAGLFGLCFHRYTWLFHVEKKTSRQSSSQKAKQEETQTSKMQPLQSEWSEQEQAAPRRKRWRRILQQSWHLVQVGYLMLLA